MNFFVCVLLLALKCNGQRPDLFNEKSGNALRQFLQKELNDSVSGPENPTRFFSANIKSDTNTKQEILIYVSGESWCGSGECRMWVIEHNGNSFTVISETSIVKLPIRALRSRTDGRADIGI